jgi:hypothetical protein
MSSEEIIPASDGGFVICGTIRHENNEDIMVLKTDENGRIMEPPRKSKVHFEDPLSEKIILPTAKPSSRESFSLPH